jgi:hypothetical protein
VTSDKTPLERLRDRLLATMAVDAARSKLKGAALAAVSASYGDETNQYYAASCEYADEHLALAARDLVNAINELPKESRPIGWDK